MTRVREKVSISMRDLISVIPVYYIGLISIVIVIFSLGDFLYAVNGFYIDVP